MILMINADIICLSVTHISRDLNINLDDKNNNLAVSGRLA